MAARESFLFRADKRVLDALRKWAADDLRSANAQLDWILRQALRDAGRLKTDGSGKGTDEETDTSGDEASST
ncbi:MAG TPA: hypothetical protein DCQ98_05345 [Planctomycetaceae bacterium]|nr:hypothetical protein [Planctomycetaceae bacterium]